MTTIEEICAHKVSFDYFTRSKNAVPSESEIEHVTQLITQGYHSGELCLATYINNRLHEFRGWWKIITT